MDEKTSIVETPGYKEYMMHVGEIAVDFETLKAYINYSIAVLDNPKDPENGMERALGKWGIPSKLTLLKHLCKEGRPDLDVDDFAETATEANNTRIAAVHNGAIAFTVEGARSPLVLVHRDGKSVQSLTLEQLRRRVEAVQAARRKGFDFLAAINKGNREEQDNPQGM